MDAILRGLFGNEGKNNSLIASIESVLGGGITRKARVKIERARAGFIENPTLGRKLRLDRILIENSDFVTGSMRKKIRDSYKIALEENRERAKKILKTKDGVKKLRQLGKTNVFLRSQYLKVKKTARRISNIKALGKRIKSIRRNMKISSSALTTDKLRKSLNRAKSNMANLDEDVKLRGTAILSYRITDLDGKKSVKRDLPVKIDGMTKKDLKKHINTWIQAKIQGSYEEIIVDSVKINGRKSVLFPEWMGADLLVNNSSIIKEYTYLGASIDDDLEKMYKNAHGINCSKVYIMKYLRTRRGKPVYNSIDEIDLPDGGVKTSELFEYLKKNNYKYYAIDAWGKIIGLHKKGVNKPLIFAICNSHIYNIPDKRRRLAIVRRNQLGGKMKFKTKFEPKYVRKFLTKELYDNLREGKCPMNRWECGEVVALGDKIYKNYDVSELKATCRKLGLDEVSNQSMALSKFKNNYPVSCLSPEMAKKFDNIKKVAISHVFKQTDEPEKVRAIDKRRFHLSILMDKNVYWPQFGPTTEFIPWGKRRRSESHERSPKSHGFRAQEFRAQGGGIEINSHYRYDIKTENRSLFHGNGNYKGSLIVQAMTDDINMEILGYYKPMRAIPNNPEWIEKMRKKMKKENINEDTRKLMFNQFIGSLNRIEAKKVQGTTVVGMDDASYMICKYGALGMRDDKIDNVFHIEIQKKWKKYINHQFIYYTIIDEANLRVYRKCKELESIGATLIAIKSDSIRFIGKNIEQYPDKDGSEPGTWCNEPINYCNREWIPKNYPVYIPKKDKPLDGILYTGRAGTGKTYNLLKHKNDIDRYVSYMNKSARNLPSGRTIDCEWGGPNIKAGKLPKVENRTIGVDEIFCIPLLRIWYLYCLTAHKGYKIIGAGDPYQLRMSFMEGIWSNVVEKHSEELIKKMCPNAVTLTKVFRYDKDLEINTNPSSPNLMATRKAPGGIYTEDFLHIVHANDTRLRILEKYEQKGLHLIDVAPYTPLKNNYTKKYYLGEIYTRSDILKNKWDLKKFELAYAITTHKAQGETIHKKIVIHDIMSMISDPRLCYTAMTRATAMNKLYRI